MLERIGRKQLHPKIGVFGSKFPVASLPYSVQERIMSGEKFDLLVANGDSIKVSAFDATRDQFAQLFGRDGVRTLAQQKLLLEDKKVKDDVRRAEALPVYVSGGRLFIRGDGKDRVFTKKQLQDFLMWM
jgi:hypothetical protein